jgi:hypothetical protein
MQSLQFVIPVIDCKIILKWVLTEIENEDVDSIHLAHDKNHWLTGTTGNEVSASVKCGGNFWIY